MGEEARIDAIMAVMEAAFDPLFGEAWTRRQVADALALPRTHALLVDGDGRIGGDGEAAGFALSRHVLDEEELLLLAVRPERRGCGIGSALIEALIRQSHERGNSKLFLEMRDDNPAERLYRRYGFREIGRRRDYYRRSDGGRIDAITFARDLHDDPTE